MGKKNKGGDLRLLSPTEARTRFAADRAMWEAGGVISLRAD